MFCRIVHFVKLRIPCLVMRGTVDFSVLLKSDVFHHFVQLKNDSAYGYAYVFEKDPLLSVSSFSFVNMNCWLRLRREVVIWS